MLPRFKYLVYCKRKLCIFIFEAGYFDFELAATITIVSQSACGNQISQQACWIPSKYVEEF